MKKIIIIITILVCCNISFAQISAERQVIGSTGNLTNTGAIIASSNVGEVVISTFTQSTMVATQGFEQPDTSMTVGINPFDASEINISIYPNPTYDYINIEAPENSQLRILNDIGQLIETFAINSRKTKVDVSIYAAGIYFVEVKTEKGIESKKFIKL